MSGARTTDFGVRLRRLREAAGLTQEELASRAGLTAKGIGALERGERKRPHPHTVEVLAAALDISGEEREAFVGAVPKRTGMAFALPTELEEPSPTLSVPPTPLIGRERAVAAIRSSLERDGARLVTLTGAGGVGKTRLAVEVANAVRDQFLDGVAFVALAPLNDTTLLLSTVAQILGLREGGGRSARELVHGYLRNKRLLLVLDNLEHLLGAAPEVAVMLSACPSLKILATSRALLRVRGEREYAVPPLDVPDPTRTPDAEGTVASPAAELFVERAREANPSFFLTQKNAAAVAAICWRLDGLPLALELAAARTRFLGPTELLSRLDQALSAGGARDLPERQRTMRATLDWSHDLLSEKEKVLFRRLSVFAGGFVLEAAEAVGTEGEVGAKDVLGLLGSLVEQSLVAAEASPSTGEDTRYRMLEPVRQYALKKLEESGEEEQVHTRHVTFYGALAARARLELRRVDQAAWLDRLAHEHDNLRTMLSWLLERDEVERVVHIGWAIWPFWSLRGHTGEGRRWMERAFAKGKNLPSSARARAFWVIAVLSFARGEVDRAAEILDKSIAAAGDAEILATALMLRGLAALSAGDLSTAERTLARTLKLFRERGDNYGVAHALIGLAQLAMAPGDFDRAANLLAEAETLSREEGDRFTLSANLSVQALAARLRGDEERANVLLQECVGLAAALRDAWTVVLGTAGLAGVAVRRGQPDRAARLFGAVEVLHEKMGVDVSWSAWRALNERDLAGVREKLDAEAFEVAWAEGQAMTLEEVVAEALTESI